MTSKEYLRNVERAADLVDSAHMLLIVSGAGMGVDSGLPDFRGNEGFWRNYPALGRSRIDFYSAASPRTFRQNPALAWGFYGHRLEMYRRIQPHDGFQILKNWGEALPGGCLAFTTNVDGHFQKAGFDARHLVEAHGSIHFLQCLNACSDDIWPADDFVPQIDEENCLLLNEPPRCPHCGSMARPNILMFGDAEWVEERTARQHNTLNRWLMADHNKKLLIIELGAGTAVATARSLTEQVSAHFNAPAIRINPREPDVNNGNHIGLGMGALQALREIDARLNA